MKDPKDGFDLIEYPCEYGFKAMCRANAEQTAEDYIRAIIEAEFNAADLLAVRSNASRTGKFESVTFTIKLESREQLEAIYDLVAGAERVVMTL